MPIYLSIYLSKLIGYLSKEKKEKKDREEGRRRRRTRRGRNKRGRNRRGRNKKNEEEIENITRLVHIFEYIYKISIYILYY